MMQEMIHWVAVMLDNLLMESGLVVECTIRRLCSLLIATIGVTGCMVGVMMLVFGLYLMTVLTDRKG